MAKFIGGDQQHVRGILTYGSSDLPPVGPTASSATFGLARHSHSTVVHYFGSFPLVLEDTSLKETRLITGSQKHDDLRLLLPLSHRHRGPSTRQKVRHLARPYVLRPLDLSP